MIRLEHVTKAYSKPGGEVRALDDVSLEVAAGQFVAICGPSGSGKSTLLSLVGGLALPSSGRVVVAGQEISSLSAGERSRFRAKTIGFVFQLFHLLPYLTVLDNVLLAAPTPADGQLRQRAVELLERFGLADRMAHRPGQLSAGERQRVAMARALLNDPPILLADEPTGNLDPDNARQVLDLVDQFHRDGGTVLLVTHQPAAASRAETVLRLESGRLVDQLSHA